MKKLILASSVVLLLAARAEASCYGYSSVPSGTVCGTIVMPDGSTPTNALYNVKFCRPGDPYACMGAFTYMSQDYYKKPLQAFISYGWGSNGTAYLDWDVFVWNDDVYYGSSTVPINREWISGYGVHGLRYVALPRALPPTPVYPSHGSTNVPNTNLTVVWDSGIDAARDSSRASWTIEYKYWESWEPEPVGWTTARAGMPCHDDGSGPDAQRRCSTLVAGPQPLGNWKWRVIATYDVSDWVPAYMGPTRFETISGAAQFTH